MLTIGTLWREPLVHFLIIGAGLFLLFELVAMPGGDATNRIVVTNSQVEQLTAQFKRTWLRPPTDGEHAGLIDSFVRDEVYYREALSLGLDKDDPLIRRRMRQKLEFILEDISAESEPSDQVLEDFLRQHADQFGVQPRVSFHQIYLNPEKRADLEADAEKILADLGDGVAPETLGDPTLVTGSFRSASQREIARSFGREFAEEIVLLEPGEWRGPFFSGLGLHLVRITERKKGYLPELDDIRTQVEGEYLTLRRRKFQESTYKKLLEGYEVVVEQAKTGGKPGDAIAATDGDEAGE